MASEPDGGASTLCEMGVASELDAAGVDSGCDGAEGALDSPDSAGDGVDSLLPEGALPSVPATSWGRSELLVGLPMGSEDGSDVVSGADSTGSAGTVGTDVSSPFVFSPDSSSEGAALDSMPSGVGAGVGDKPAAPALSSV